MYWMSELRKLASFDFIFFSEKFLTDEEIELLLNQSDVDVSDDEDTVDYFHDSSDDETDSGDTDTEVPRSKGQEKDKRRDPFWKVKE